MEAQMHLKIVSTTGMAIDTKVIVVMDDGSEVDITRAGLMSIDWHLDPYEPAAASITMRASRLDAELLAKLKQVGIVEAQDVTNNPD